MSVTVNFNASVENWHKFADGLNESVPRDAMVDFRFGDPVMHEMFCSFVFLFEQKFRLETAMAGPGVQCLVVNYDTLGKRCVEIVARFEKNALNWGLLPWMGQIVRLTELGYNIKAEVPRPVNPAWLSRYRRTGRPVNIEVVIPTEGVEFKKGFQKSSQSCDGEHAIIWDDGKYYPCHWCVLGGLKYPVYDYGKLGEPFEKKGKQECHLRECPYKG